MQPDFGEGVTNDEQQPFRHVALTGKSHVTVVAEVRAAEVSVKDLAQIENAEQRLGRPLANEQADDGRLLYASIEPLKTRDAGRRRHPRVQRVTALSDQA